MIVIMSCHIITVITEAGMVVNLRKMSHLVGMYGEILTFLDDTLYIYLLRIVFFLFLYYKKQYIKTYIFCY